MTTRIKDVATRAGVSSATVSRVLSNKPHVSEEVRRRILAAIEELGYQPSRVARSLRIQRSRIIGLIISDIQNPFFNTLARAVEDVAYAYQYAVFLCNSDEDIEKEKLYIDLMQAEQVAGVMISPTQQYDNPCQRLIRANIPVVVIDRRVADLDIVDTVVVDNIAGARTLVSHLIDDGHRRIGAVLGTAAATTGRERYEGYTQALLARDLPIVPDLIRTGIPKEADGYRLTQQLLDLPEPPAALFTGNDLLTLGALKAIRDRRLSIPDDIALGAFDELDWMSLVKPPLTVVAQPTYDIGRTAADLLLKRIEERDRPIQTIEFQPDFIIRQSCARHPDAGAPAQKPDHDSHDLPIVAR
jgi:DNA-binding LacI/PurR family transcriptional regulator